MFDFLKNLFRGKQSTVPLPQKEAPNLKLLDTGKKTTLVVDTPDHLKTVGYSESFKSDFNKRFGVKLN